MKNLMLGAALVAAFILVLGSVGALEQSHIGGFQCLIQCGIGIGLAWFAFRKIMEG